MMPAQLVNVAECATHQPPPPEQFLAELKLGLEALAVQPTDTALFGETFQDPVPQPDGSEKNQKGGYTALMNFQKICEMKGYKTEFLDDYFCAFVGAEHECSF